MQAYDLIMILVLVGATIFGAWKGMAWQLASLASLVASYFVALRVAPSLATSFGDSEPWNLFVAMLVVYMATSLVVWLLFRLVAGLIDRVKLKEFDRQLGALFGLAKGVLLCVAITFFAVSLLPEDKKRDVLGSRSGYYIGVLLSRTHDVVPPEIHDVIHPYLEEIQERLDPASAENQTAAVQPRGGANDQ
jgi:membrane protein required for colicin V production